MLATKNRVVAEEHAGWRL